MRPHDPVPVRHHDPAVPPVERPIAPPPPDDAGAVAHRGFGARLLSAVRLDASVYDEVEHDPRALPQAAAVVGLAALTTALGALGMLGLRGLLAGVVLAGVSWAVWTTIVWAIGVKLLHHTSDFEELLRTLGFVAAPQLLWLLAIVPWPLLHGLLAVVIGIMTLVSFFLAVRQALDIGSGRALLVSLLAVGSYLVLGVAVGGLV